MPDIERSEKKERLRERKERARDNLESLTGGRYNR